MAYLLIVDDDEDFTNALEIVLCNAGYEVQTRQDIEGGLRYMKERPPDLVILDVMFPEDSSAGFELARIMREEETLKNTPVLILSAVNTKFFIGFGKEDIDKDWRRAYVCYRLGSCGESEAGHEYRIPRPYFLGHQGELQGICSVGAGDGVLRAAEGH